jgi:5'-3' exonuclease
MDKLKKQFIRIKDHDIRNVKDLMDSYGVNYFDSHTEADVLCAYLVKIGKADICMSDDMDMFLYGCPFVLRHFSLMNHTVILYDTKKILEELNMTDRHFCEIMVLSGTDYNMNSNTSLNETIRWFHQYKKYCSKQKEKNEKSLEFYVWLYKNTKYISDYHHLLKTYQLFQIENNKDLKQWDDLIIEKKTINLDKLKNIMKTEGFLFD